MKKCSRCGRRVRVSELHHITIGVSLCRKCYIASGWKVSR